MSVGGTPTVKRVKLMPLFLPAVSFSTIDINFYYIDLVIVVIFVTIVFSEQNDVCAY